MEITLKDQLKTIKHMKYQVPKGTNPNELALEMLKEVGNTDGELRDDLIYSIMSKWIIGGVFTHEQLRGFLKLLMTDQTLRLGLGKEKDDSVFTRSFVILHLVLIVYKHVRHPFLSEAEINDIYSGIMHVIPAEKDLRGFDVEKGWAHIVAHTADLLDELVYVTELDDIQIFGILKAVQFLVYKDSLVYVDFEEERLAEVIASIVKEKRLPFERLILWLEGFTISQIDLVMPEVNRLKKNVKGFLQALYFKLKAVDDSDEISRKILKLIGTL